MIDLLEIEVKIAKISNCQGSALASGAVCLARVVSVPKICAEIAAKSSSFKERVGARLLSHLLPQKLLCWQACSVSMLVGKCVQI